VEADAENVLVLDVGDTNNNLVLTPNLADSRF
jgi:hypothetical protein